MIRRSFTISPLALVFLVLLDSPASGQEQPPSNPTVRVIQDGAPLWRRNPSFIIAVAKMGTILEVVGRERQWLQVIVPPELGGHGETAFIWQGLIELESGTLPPESVYQPPPDAPPTRVGPSSRAKAMVGRGIGQAAYHQFTADRSFEALFGESTGWNYGGGLQVVFRPGIFVEFTVDYLEKTGERVFVSGDDVFKLGISDRVRLIPLTFSAGYRVPGLGRVVPYGGGGGGITYLKEESDFADTAENVDDHFGSYHLVGGVEVRGTEWASTAFEVQWSRVPDSLGVGGVSQAFSEDDLGGLSFRIRVLIGK